MEQKITDEQQWLEERKKYVTSTEVGVLFGVSEYESAYSLWHRKRGFFEKHVEETERMRFGKALEPVVAQEFQRRMGLPVAPDNIFRSHDETPLGASYDFECGEKSKKSLEVKCVDSFAFRDKFISEKKTILEFPPGMELQFQAQMFLRAEPSMYVATLVGGNTLYITEKAADLQIQAEILRQVQAFWASTEPPAIDPEKDAEAVALIYKRLDGEVREGTPVIEQMVRDYHRYKETEKAAFKAKKKVRTLLMKEIGHAGKVVGKGYSISRFPVAEALTSYKRSAYTGMRITVEDQNDEKPNQ